MEERVFGGRYRATRYAGVPGRVQAWEGVDQSTGAPVIIMTAEPEEPDDVSRWTQRAQAVAALTAPEIARIEDWGESEGVFYVIQQWVEGTVSPKATSQYGPASADRIARWGAQVASALAMAHEAGVIHGDVRPEDIIILPSDDAVLAGLGDPLVNEALRLPEDAPAEAAHYLSPEQCEGLEATVQSDIYGLGAVLYRLATGSVPFDGPSALEVAELQRTATLEPPRRVNAAIPPSLEHVIQKAMAKDPAARYTTAEEMRAELERISEGMLAAATAVMDEIPEKKRRWPWFVAGGVALVALTLFVLWWFGILGGSKVPDLSGERPDQAAKILEDEGLALGKVDAEQDYPASAVPGTIFEQTPEPGRRVRKGTPIDVVLAGGNLQVVPDLTGNSESQAIANIQQAGFKLGQVTRQYSDKVPMGTVISQVPSATTEAVEGSPIDLVVSQGVEQAEVPNVVGQTQAAATQALQNAKFKVDVRQEPNDAVVRGNVISQAPAAGVFAAAGSTVQIIVSSGPAPVAQVRVPDVTGLSENAAIEELTKLGLIPQIQNVAGTTANAGNVVGQSPSAGIQVAPASRVTIRVARATSTTTSTP